MTNLFLKARHWQLFLLMFAIPFALQMAVALSVVLRIFESVQRNHQPDPTLIFQCFKWFVPIMVLYLGVHFGWFYSIVNGLAPKAPQGVVLKVTRFKILLLIPIIYLTAIGVLLACFFGSMLDGAVPNPRYVVFGLFIFIPLHLFSMFCIFHSMYFVAKTFKTVELQKEVAFSDFAAEFFMLWFYPLGVWILQPKINNLAEVK